MKIKILQYCQHYIDGALIILDANKILDVSNKDATNLINLGFAEKVEGETVSSLTGLEALNSMGAKESTVYSSTETRENKMIDVNYSKKRGRLKKEV